MIFHQGSGSLLVIFHQGNVPLWCGDLSVIFHRVVLVDQRVIFHPPFVPWKCRSESCPDAVTFQDIHYWTDGHTCHGHPDLHGPSLWVDPVSLVKGFSPSFSARGSGGHVGPHSRYLKLPGTYFCPSLHLWGGVEGGYLSSGLPSYCGCPGWTLPAQRPSHPIQTWLLASGVSLEEKGWNQACYQSSGDACDG